MAGALSERFDRALLLASSLHRRQMRKGTSVPYVSHLLATAAIVLEHGGGEDEAIAALLHDAVEDCGAEQLQKIREMFGEPVARIVDACSDTDQQPKPPWRDRKEAYIARIATEPSEARLVSAADKLHNARCILADYREHGEALWDRFNKDADQLWYYRSLVRAFRAAGDHGALIDELERVVDELERLVQGSGGSAG
jgi:(p)ppGpp synthase/HD superfamily hydrolase